MMQRSLSLPRPRIADWNRQPDVSARDRDPSGSRDLRLWRALWLPYWTWSDAPAPELPRRETALPAQLGLAGQAVVSGIDRIRRRLWLSHAAAHICRGLWLGLLCAAILMLIDVLGGPAFNPRIALALGGVLLVGGLVLATLCKPSRVRAARMLDRSFALHERLTTALDDLGLGVPMPGERAPVVYLQMADAANAIAVLRKDPRLRPAIPVREVVLAVLMGLILCTLAFARGLTGNLPALAEGFVPPFTPAIERPVAPEPSATELQAAEMAPTVQEVIDRSDRSAQAQHDLHELASALSDHAMTRAAAEQIAAGEYEGAGDELREAGEQAGALSESARSGLASDLEQASEAMRPETSGLHEATRDAAAGLEGDQEAARTEMRDLADAVEQAGSQIVPQSELASQMRNAQQSQSQRSQSASQTSNSAQSQQANANADAAAMAELGSGADASDSTGAPSSEQQQTQTQNAALDPRSGAGQSGAQEGQQSGNGEAGQANAPGEGDQAGQGQSGAQGNPSNSDNAGQGMPQNGDSETARQGGGAGTGSGDEQEAAQAGGGDQNVATQDGETPADPNVSTGSGAEGDPAAIGGGNDQMALPAGSGDQGVQTSPDGGSALRGSGAGVTAGSGYAVQGDVGEAGPDSNRVPPQHRDTVERYFSSGGE